MPLPINIYMSEKPLFEGSSPKLTFIFGLITGLAATSVLAVLILISSANGKAETGKVKPSVNDKQVADNGGQTPPSQGGDPSPSPAPNPNIVLPTVSDTDHVLGKADAKVTIVEFSDFQCPYCQRHHPTLQRISKEYGDDVRWVYKHFPLDSIHPNARPAAEASECVADLGGNDAFWQYADKLFANQSSLGDDLYVRLAKEVGVKEDAFKKCYESQKFAERVDADYSQGIQAGVTGTPGNIIIANGSGVPVSGAVPYEQFQSIIDSLLAK